MTGDQLQLFLRDLRPYSQLPCFEEVVKRALAKARVVPSWFPIPERLRDSLQPDEQRHLFLDRPSEFESWLPSVFRASMADFSETDDFSYLKLFTAVAEFCFTQRRLYQILATFCEAHFLETYHPAYCVIRVRLAIHNSPLSKVDRLRPLCLLVVQAINGDPDWKLIETAASIAPPLAQIPLSMPHFTMKFRLKSYITAFGVTRAEKPIWMGHLSTGNEEAILYMQSNPLFARVIGISLVQKSRANQAFVFALAGSRPQCDVAHMMCRNYERLLDSILRSWAGQNGAVLIDYLTLCVAKGLPRPSISVPQLTDEQRAIYEAFDRL
jgi:hypothetical protein